MKYLAVVLVALSVLGCTSKPQSFIPFKIPIDNSPFSSVRAQIYTQPDSVNYDLAWKLYLASLQPANTEEIETHLENIKAQIDSGTRSCNSVDWEALTLESFWSVDAHLYAAECYDFLAMPLWSDAHKKAANFIIKGSQASGDGKYDYSAFEIANWSNAQAIVRFLGLDFIDSYTELKHSGQALFYVVVANDPVTGFQHELYFENNRYLHAMVGIPFPFASLENALELQIVDRFTASYSFAQIAKAKILESSGNYEQAALWYQKAIEAGSPYANYFQGMLCLNRQLRQNPSSECLNFLQRAAKGGLVKASVALAFSYMEGLGVEKDTSLALQILQDTQERCAPGEVWWELGLMFDGVGGVKDIEQLNSYLLTAESLGFDAAGYDRIVYTQLRTLDLKDSDAVSRTLYELHKVAAKGIVRAQGTYARLLLETQPNGSDEWNGAKYWVEQAVKGGLPLGYELLGIAFNDGLFGEQDDKKAFAAFLTAAQMYLPESQRSVGVHYDEGTGIEQDKLQALSWYSLCAQAEDLGCMHNYAVFLKDGEVVPQDFEMAAKLFSYAAEKGLPESMLLLGWLLLDGEGIHQSIDEANAWFLKSCDRALAVGCYELGTSYLQGEGVAQNYSQAYTLFSKSCELGFYEGCRNLAIAYEQAIDVQKDISRAEKLYRRACVLGSSEACEYVESQFDGKDE